jgi:DNA polymerase, archaea type
MVTDWRSLAVIENGSVHLDEKLLDPFDVSTTDYSGFNPAKTIKPYESVVKAVIDLETTGLEPEKHRIIMIGVELYGGFLDEQKVIRADDFDNNDERSMLIELGRYLKATNAEYLIFYNGHKFDLPFLKKRMELNKIDSQITFDYDFETTLRNTTGYDGQPLKFYQPNHPKYKFIDTMNLVYQDDFVTRKLTSKSLKQVPVQWGMRAVSDRLELTYQEILDCWANVANGGLDRLEEYLRDDLQDTRMLTDKLLPNYYYQFEVLPKFYDIQKICNWGNATKTNHLLQEIYGYKPEPEIKLSFRGGYTEANQGFYEYPSKIDFSSLYPHIMLAYDITSYKDHQKFLLKYLHYFKTERLLNKALGKKGDKIAKGKEGYMKIFINSMYGCLGVTNKPFNDMVAAAAVTAYGRALVKLMKQAVLDNGGTIIGIDTDGIVYNSFSSEENKRIYLEILKVMPKGFNTEQMIEYEWSERAIFIPPS